MNKEQKLSLLFIYVLQCVMAMSRCMIFMSGCVAILMRVRVIFYSSAIYWWMALQLSHRSCEYSWSAIVEHIQWIIFTFTLNIFDFDLLRLNWKLNLRWWDIFFMDSMEKKMFKVIPVEHFFSWKNSLFSEIWSLVFELDAHHLPK